MFFPWEFYYQVLLIFFYSSIIKFCYCIFNTVLIPSLFFPPYPKSRPSFSSWPTNLKSLLIYLPSHSSFFPSTIFMEPSCVPMLRVGTEQHIKKYQTRPFLQKQSSWEFDTCTWFITTLSSIQIRPTDAENSQQWGGPLASPGNNLYSFSHILSSPSPSHSLVILLDKVSFC